ncbi:MAG: hypothetical protein QW039_06540 [Fervidicoccaceae archaeon]
MNLIEEIVKAREAGTELKGLKASVLKAAILLLSLISIALPHQQEISIAIAILSSVLLSVSGAFRVLLGGYFLFSTTVIPIDAISLAYGGSFFSILRVTTYTLSTMLSLILFISTTDNSDLESLFGRRRIIIYTYSSIFYFMNSLKNVEDSFKSRGYEARVRNPWSFVPLLISYVYFILEKMESVAESIEARGGD